MTAIDTSLTIDTASRIAARLFSQAAPLDVSFAATLAAQIHQSDAQAATTDQPQSVSDPAPQPQQSAQQAPPQTLQLLQLPQGAQQPTPARDPQSQNASAPDQSAGASGDQSAPQPGAPASAQPQAQDQPQTQGQPQAPARADSNGAASLTDKPGTTDKRTKTDKDDTAADPNATPASDPSTVAIAAVPVVANPAPVKPSGGGDSAVATTSADAATIDTIGAVGATGTPATSPAITGQAAATSAALVLAAKATPGKPGKAAATDAKPSASPASNAPAPSAPAIPQSLAPATGLDIVIGKPADGAQAPAADASNADLAKLGLTQTASATTSATPTAPAAPTPLAAVLPSEVSAKPLSVAADAIASAATTAADQPGKLPDLGSAPKGATPGATSFTVATALDLSRTGPASTVPAQAQPALRQNVPIDRVAFEVVSQAKSGVREVEIKLDPPELGSISVKMDMDDSGRVSAHLVVEKSSTLDQLRSDAPRLERMLSDAGLKTDSGSLQFSLRDQQSQSRQGNDARRARRGSVEIDPVDLNAWRGSAATTNLAAQRGGIDIRL